MKFGVVKVRLEVAEEVAAADKTKVVSDTLTTVVPAGIPVPETTWPGTTAELLPENVAVVLLLVRVMDCVKA